MNPVYEFKCKQCDEVYESYDKNAYVECCDLVARRVYSVGGIAFKGTGFYSTDEKWSK